MLETMMRGESGQIGYLLRQANVIHRFKVEKILEKFKVTLPQYSILSFCALYPGLSNADLARGTFLTPQTLSVIIANLEDKDLIVRCPHEIHGRIQHINLTKKGRNLLKKCDKPMRAFQKKLLVGFSAKEAKIIRRWLMSMVAQD
jgi:DNA-binding MarR family transcriptional regulator